MNKQLLRQRIYQIIFEAETRTGKFFDVCLLIAILTSTCIVFFESVPGLSAEAKAWFTTAEWAFTILFLAEYLLRLWSVNKPVHYALSFYGVIDLLSILPAFLGLFIVGGQSLLVIRVLRLLRIFRILKLARYIRESNMLVKALIASRIKIGVFLFSVLILVFILGTIMYLIEGEENGFTSIPKSIYWAIVTLTTVGYGDIAPQTNMGQFVASFVMILGYAIIAVPTGIVTVELNQVYGRNSTLVCPTCMKEGHDADARYCKFCGNNIHDNENSVPG